MARQPLNVKMASQTESFRIRLSSISPNMRGNFIHFSRVERIFYLSVGITAVILMSSIVFVRMKTLEIQNVTNQMNTKMAATQNQITQYNQALQDLTSSGKVGATASSAGMTINNSNVKKASK